MAFRMSLKASCVVVLLAVTACGSSATGTENEAPIELKLVHEESATDVQGRYANKFKELVEKRSNGQIDVTTYSAGQLGTNEDHFKMVEDNVVQAAISTPSITGSIIPENQVLSVPFVFSDDMSVNYRVLRTSTALNEDLASIYEDRGIKALSFWTEGFMAWTSNRPISNPEGMENLRIRTMTSPMLLKSYSALGASPTSMDAGEVYTALQTNMIDATVNPLFFLYSGNTHEVQEYLTLARHHIYVTSTLMNEDFLNSLPRDLRGVVKGTVDDLEEWSFDYQKKANRKALDAMRDSDIEVVELTDKERQVYREMARPVRDQVGDVASPRASEILDSLISEVQDMEKRSDS